MLYVEAPPGLQKDRTEHRFAELTGGSILLAGMEGADERRLAGAGAVKLVVTEDEAGAAGDRASIAKDGEINVKGQASERDDHFQMVRISSGSGLLSGGAQRTAALM